MTNLDSSEASMYSSCLCDIIGLLVDLNRMLWITFSLCVDLYSQLICYFERVQLRYVVLS